MKLVPPLILPLLLMACSSERGQPAQPVDAAIQQGRETMEISRSSTRQPTAGPAEYFSGSATITSLFNPRGPSKVGAALVRFEPGARTAWHTHPLGQRLVVTEGTGWTQVEGGAVEAFHAGDVIWCPPDRKHWHGATPTSAMAHIAIQEAQDGSPVTWLEQVTNEEYLAGQAAR